MKKIILFAVVLGVLTGGIIFYAQKMQEETVPQVVVQQLKQEIQIVHPKWKDVFVNDVEPGRIYRKKTKEYATILELTDNSITIEWDRWGVEKFVKDKDGSYRLSN